MNVLIKSAIITNAKSKYHGKKRDILITNGKIDKIAVSIKNTKNAKEISRPNLHISAGWFDSSVSFGEPGFEERETLKKGLNVAEKCGFTAIGLNPNTNPVIDNKSNVEFLKNASNDKAIDLYPIANLTQGANGQEMAELYDMHSSGAIAFGDYNIPIKNPNLLKIALQYCQNFNGLVLSFPQQDQISNDGLMNEGVQSTKMGLKGNPGLAEELQISRDLFLLSYTGGKLHIPTISTANSVKLIADAKKKGLDVSCSVAAHHLCLTENEISDFNTNFKVNPPLRTKSAVNALIKGVKNRTIDMIVSDHVPMDIEHKKVDFQEAYDGSIGLESLFGAVLPVLGIEDTIAALTHRPRSRFGLPEVLVQEGEFANLSLFNPQESYQFQDNHILSTSKNAAFLNKNLMGKAYGIINNNKLVLNS